MTKTIAITFAALIALASPAAYAQQYSMADRHAIGECAYQYLVQTGQIYVPHGGLIPHAAFFSDREDDHLFDTAVSESTTTQELCIAYAEIILHTETTIMTMFQ